MPRESTLMWRRTEHLGDAKGRKIVQLHTRVNFILVLNNYNNYNPKLFVRIGRLCRAIGLREGSRVGIIAVFERF